MAPPADRPDPADSDAFDPDTAAQQAPAAGPAPAGLASLPLSGPVHAPAAGTAVRAVVVLLHGLGADGHDLIALAPTLARALPGALFLAPDAPQPCDMAPMGRQWFSLQDRSPAAIAAGTAQAATVVHGYLDAVLAVTGVPSERLALVGFSQGAMMALQVGPERAGLGGIVGFSGLLAGAAGLSSRARGRPPVCLIHGTHDEIVPVTGSAHAQGALEALGFPVEAHWRHGLGHGIDPEGLGLALRFLVRVLGAGDAQVAGAVMP